MRIALDGACISPRLTGVGRYFQCLLRELVPLDPKIEYTLFMKDEFDPGLSFPNLHTIVLRRKGSYFLWQNTLLRRAVAGRNFDLFWSPNYTIPLALWVPSLVTVHDLSWMALPGNYPAWARCYKNLTAHYGLRRAKGVFTDSDFSKDEIARRTPVAAGKVKRIHLAVDNQFQRVDKEGLARFRSLHGLCGKPVIGFLGSMFPRRHIAEALAAFAIVRTHHPAAMLFVVGDNYSSPTLEKALAGPGIIWKKRLPEEEINAFYSSLNLFLYLSDYEGFGLPPMEALNCGTVSLLLPKSSLAELYGNLALFVDQPDPDRIAGGISRFLQHEEEIRAPLLSRWQDRKPYFSWKRAAAEYLREIKNLQ
jgi:glycosyltransferase involved in cell wall biosynthesis